MARHSKNDQFTQISKILKITFWLGLIASLSLLVYSLYGTGNHSSEVANISSQPQVSVETAQTLNCGHPLNTPNDNPIQQKYGAKAYPWTNNLKWNCVYLINDFPGKNFDEKFQVATQTVTKNGGGTIYFPAGTYQFQDDIVLSDGVILRGETPSLSDAKSQRYRLATQFVFPQYKPSRRGEGTPNQTAFKKILTQFPNTDSNLGIINIDINRAAIELKANLNLAQNRNLVVFGVRSNNVAETEAKVPDLTFQPAWLRYSDRFAANIKINASENVLVSNNRLNDQITDNFTQPGYKIKALKGDRVITYTDGDDVPFDYGNHYGIVVNRSGQFGVAETPETQPGLFHKGIAIRDNWVYHTMRVAIHASGQGLVIQDNEIRDRKLKQWWTDPTGLKEPRGAVTYENRAIDWSGWDVKITGNQYEVYRHRVMDSRYLSVDGEGILIQECCGGTLVKGVTISNNHGNAYIGLYKTRDIENVQIIDNQLTPENPEKALIYVNADTNNHPYGMNNVHILRNTLNGGILAKASTGGQGNKIEQNMGQSNSPLVASCHVKIINNQGFKLSPCS